jgi:hypothetical protein
VRLPKPSELDAQTGLFAGAKVASAAEPSESAAYSNSTAKSRPVGTVQVNQGCGISCFTHRTQFAFGHGGDHSSYVGRECSPVRSSGNLKIELAEGCVKACDKVSAGTANLRLPGEGQCFEWMEVKGSGHADMQIRIDQEF